MTQNRCVCLRGVMRVVSLSLLSSALFDFISLCEALGLGLRTNSWMVYKLSVNSRGLNSWLLLIKPGEPTGLSALWLCWRLRGCVRDGDLLQEGRSVGQDDVEPGGKKFHPTFCEWIRWGRARGDLLDESPWWFVTFCGDHCGRSLVSITH